MLKSWFSAKRTSSVQSRRPAIEPLEGRQLLSVSAGSGSGVVVSPTPVPPIITPVFDTIVGDTIDPVVGKKWTGAVGKYSPIKAIPLTTGSSFSLKMLGSIDWGDGHSSAATLSTSSTGAVTLTGSHTYAKVGTYTTSMSLVLVPVGKPGQPLPQFIVLLATGTGEADVSGQALQGLTIYPVAGESFTAAIAKLNFAVPPIGGAPPIFAYGASIDWGDGTTSEGAFGLDKSTGDSDVIGTHTYAKAGKYKIHIVVSFGPAPGSGAEFPSKILAQIDSVANVLSVLPPVPLPV